MELISVLEQVIFLLWYLGIKLWNAMHPPVDMWTLSW
jgi:hypothetical protein